MTAPLVVDGAQGEGGGQVLRTALALAVVLGRPVRVVRVRAGRARPGLRPQHLAAVRALAAIGNAALAGDHLGSTEVALAPHGLAAGERRIDVGAEQGSAGAVALVFHAVLLPLLRAPGPSRLVLVGGTHVPLSPPVHHVQEVFLPLLATLGVRVTMTLERLGWYPAGGGIVEAAIEPSPSWPGLVAERPDELARGSLRGLSLVSHLPATIAERQRARALTRLAAAGLAAEIALETDQAARGAGTFLWLARAGRAGFSALGRRGLPAERVADAAVDACLAWHAAGAALDEHVADQLVPLLALARGPSSFTCPALTPHLRTVAAVVGQLTGARIALVEGAPARVDIRPA